MAALVAGAGAGAGAGDGGWFVLRGTQPSTCFQRSLSSPLVCTGPDVAQPARLEVGKRVFRVCSETTTFCEQKIKQKNSMSLSLDHHILG